MARIEMEFYDRPNAVFENATYRKLGNDFVVSRNGKVCVRIGSAYVYGISIDSGGHVSGTDNAGTGTA